MKKPITPDEVISRKKESLPDEVIEAFNELIAFNWNGYQASIKQEDVCNLICKKLNIFDNIVFKNQYLDVEDIYRESGWDVKYDKPGYNEDYEAYFVFKKKGK